MVSLGTFLVPPSSSVSILIPSLNFIEVGLAMEVDRVVRVDRASIMDASRREKDKAFSRATPSSKRLWFSKTSMREGSRVRGSPERG